MRAIRTAVAAVSLSVAAAAGFVLVATTRSVEQAHQQMQADVILRGSDAIALSFNTALKREWDSLQAVADNVGDLAPREINDFVDAVGRTGGQVAWAGFADVSGRIVSGSHRLREGQDVSERRWFQEGLRRANVGSTFLSRSLATGANGQPEALLNMSRPVYDSNGNTRGVMVYSLRLAWVQSFLTDARSKLGIDIVIKTAQDQTLIDTRKRIDPLPARVLSLASLGVGGPGLFQLVGDGETGLYAFAPNFVWDSMPDFGWKVIAVLDQDSMPPVLPSLMRNSLIAVLIAAAGVLLVTFVTLSILLRPIERLVAISRKVASGGVEYAPESQSSREARELSRALISIQAELTRLRANYAAQTGTNLRPVPHADAPSDAPRGPRPTTSGARPRKTAAR